jgi:hypothetical protein
MRITEPRDLWLALRIVRWRIVDASTAINQLPWVKMHKATSSWQCGRTAVRTTLSLALYRELLFVVRSQSKNGEKWCSFRQAETFADDMAKLLM